MNLKQLLDEVTLGVRMGHTVFVTRNIVGRIGPVYEAKALGFGTSNAMLRISTESWVTVDPLMCTVSRVPRKCIYCGEDVNLGGVCRACAKVEYRNG